MTTRYRIFPESDALAVVSGWTRATCPDEVAAAAMRKITGKRFAWLHLEQHTDGQTWHVQGGYPPQRRGDTGSRMTLFRGVRIGPVPP